MSRDKIHEKIDELLGMLSIHNSRLSLHSEKLSQLDIDVFRKHCIDLYDEVNSLALKGKLKSLKLKLLRKKRFLQKRIKNLFHIQNKIKLQLWKIL